MNVEICNPTGRKTEARVVTINGNDFFFSYQTCIAFRGESGGNWRKVRISNRWGPTTGRHFNEMGCGDFEEVSTEEFDRIVEGIETCPSCRKEVA